MHNLSFHLFNNKSQGKKKDRLKVSFDEQCEYGEFTQESMLKQNEHINESNIIRNIEVIP
jgi:hypothetical protein